MLMMMTPLVGMVVVPLLRIVILVVVSVMMKVLPVRTKVLGRLGTQKPWQRAGGARPPLIPRLKC